MKFSSDDEAELQSALSQLKVQHEQLALHKELYDRAQQDVTAIMERMQRKSYVHLGTRFTMVKSSAPNIDAAGLKKALGARLYNKFTTAKLDTKKLEAAMNDGLVDTVVVAQYTSYVDRKPYLRITEDPT